MEPWSIIELAIGWFICGGIGRIITRHFNEEIWILFNAGDSKMMEDVFGISLGLINLIAAPIVCYFRHR